jgi:hypothetical protein
VFVTLFFGDRGSWVYYFLILVLGLATLARRGRGHAAVVCVLAVLLLVNDRSKLVAIGQGWSEMEPSPELLNLWATPAERAEWVKVLELTRGSEPVLVAESEGAALWTPELARPVSYFEPGRVQREFLRRKLEQLAGARMVVCVVAPDWRGFTFWPELTAALDGCELVWKGHFYTVYRRVRPPAASRPGPAERPLAPDP